jgi:hypothetical protein
MATAYELALLGAPSDDQAAQVAAVVSRIISAFGLNLGSDVTLEIRPVAFGPDPKRSAATAFFGGTGVPLGAADGLALQAIPIIPVVSDLRRIASELPQDLRRFNCLEYPSDGPERLATALLECAGLLPRQRRVFISYKRDEARAAAVQLFDALAGRIYDVFLDTHGVAPGDDFQSVLWHRLCDSDVLVMLETPGYFSSRWTAAEFGRALAKSMSVLSIGWPGCTPSARAATATRVTLSSTDVSLHDGSLRPEAVQAICTQLEIVRSESIAVRRLNLVSKIALGSERIGGRVIGVGMNTGVHLELPDGKEVVAYPIVGVPTSLTLYEASALAPRKDVAVVYDHIGMSESWLKHLEWLGRQIPTPRWVRAEEVSWRFADWEGKS